LKIYKIINCSLLHNKINKLEIDNTTVNNTLIEQISDIVKKLPHSLKILKINKKSFDISNGKFKKMFRIISKF